MAHKDHKKLAEEQDRYAKSHTWAAVASMADLYNHKKINSDIRNFEDIKSGDLEDILVEVHEKNHGKLLKDSHGFDSKSLKGLPQHKKLDVLNSLYDTNLQQIRDTIIREGADYNINKAIEQARDRGLENAVKAQTHYFTRLDSSEQMKYLNETLLKGIDTKNYEFNKGLLEANPEGVGSAAAQVNLGYNTAKNTSKQFLLKKKRKGESEKYLKAA